MITAMNVVSAAIPITALAGYCWAAVRQMRGYSAMQGGHTPIATEKAIGAPPTGGSGEIPPPPRILIVRHEPSSKSNADYLDELLAGPIAEYPVNDFDQREYLLRKLRERDDHAQVSCTAIKAATNDPVTPRSAAPHNN